MRAMDGARRLEAKALARAKARAKRLRVQTIRRRTIRGSLALFAVLWAIVFAQLASGNDPALSRVSHPKPRPVAVSHEPEPAVEPEFDQEAEAPIPEEEFAPEAEPEEEFVPEEEFPVEEEFQEPEPEPAPIITASS